MSFGISNSVMSRVVQVCTPELFHQATRSSVVKDVCSQIADALESKRRGEMNNEDFETLKTQLKKRLPILTPHATFRNGRRCNSDAIPSGFSIYDIDHIPNPRGYWEEKKKLLSEKRLEVMMVSGDLQSPASKEPASSKQINTSKEPAGSKQMISVLDLIVLVHVTPSSEGLRLVFIIPAGMSLADAQKWMSQQLGDGEYDVCVKDLARPSFIVPEDYILFINNEELFKERIVTYSLAGDCKSPERLAGANAQAQSTNHKVQSSNLKVQISKFKVIQMFKTIDFRALTAILLFLLALLFSLPNLVIAMVLLLVISALLELILMLARKSSPRSTKAFPIISSSAS